MPPKRRIRLIVRGVGIQKTYYFSNTHHEAWKLTRALIVIEGGFWIQYLRSNNLLYFWGNFEADSVLLVVRFSTSEVGKAELCVFN
jgi:hypothetical protein